MIGCCDSCDRENVPVVLVCSTMGEALTCYLCQGEDNPDPYGELVDINVNEAREV